MTHHALRGSRDRAHTIRDLMVHMRPWRMGHDHADGRMPRSAHTPHAPPRRTVRGFIAFKALERAAADRQRRLGGARKARGASGCGGGGAPCAPGVLAPHAGRRSPRGIRDSGFDPAKSRPARARRRAPFGPVEAPIVRVHRGTRTGLAALVGPFPH